MQSSQQRKRSTNPQTSPVSTAGRSLVPTEGPVSPRRYQPPKNCCVFEKSLCSGPFGVSLCPVTNLSTAGGVAEGQVEGGSRCPVSTGAYRRENQERKAQILVTNRDVSELPLLAFRSLEQKRGGRAIGLWQVDRSTFGPG